MLTLKVCYRTTTPLVYSSALSNLPHPKPYMMGAWLQVKTWNVPYHMRWGLITHVNIVTIERKKLQPTGPGNEIRTSTFEQMVRTLGSSLLC